MQIRERLRAFKQVNLSRVFGSCVTKGEVICYFLAILELARMREITLARRIPSRTSSLNLGTKKVIYVG